MGAQSVQSVGDLAAVVEATVVGEHLTIAGSIAVGQWDDVDIGHGFRASEVVHGDTACERASGVSVLSAVEWRISLVVLSSFFNLFALVIFVVLSEGKITKKKSKNKPKK